MTLSLFRDLLNARASHAELTLESEEIEQLEAYFRLLSAWNRTINLTGLPLDPPTAEAIDRLFIEPLVAAQFLSRSPLVPKSPSPLRVWIDLGSGGGSPAIPMKIALPQLDLTMVESRSRKAAFLSEAIRAFRLENARVENSRFQELSLEPGSVDLISSRAIRADGALESVAKRILRPGGWLMLFGPSSFQSMAFSSVESIHGFLHISSYVPRGTQTR